MKRTLVTFGVVFTITWCALLLTLLVYPALWEVVRTQSILVALAMTAFIVLHTGFWLSREALPRKRGRHVRGKRGRRHSEPGIIVLTSRTSGRKTRTYRSDIPHPVYASEPARESVRLPVYTPYEYTDAMLSRDARYYADLTERL